MLANKPYVVGLTGGIGCGKSEAAQYLKTGYLFEKSSSEKLNREAVAARFLKEYRLAGAKRCRM